VVNRRQWSLLLRFKHDIFVKGLKNTRRVQGLRVMCGVRGTWSLGSVGELTNGSTVRGVIQESGYLSQYSDSATGWTTGVQFPAGEKMGFFFSSPPRSDRLWGPPILLSSGYGGLLPRG
jgi:hypothetical protein